MNRFENTLYNVYIWVITTAVSSPLSLRETTGPITLKRARFAAVTRSHLYCGAHGVPRENRSDTTGDGRFRTNFLPRRCVLLRGGRRYFSCSAAWRRIKETGTESVNRVSRFPNFYFFRIETTFSDFYFSRCVNRTSRFTVFAIASENCSVVLRNSFTLNYSREKCPTFCSKI